MRKLTFLDLFAGMGGFRLALEAAGFQCVGYVEIDRHARKTYEANFDIEGEWTGHDITKITDAEIRALGRERKIDVITGGFPCQAFSIAGKRRGFGDARGNLFFDLCRFVCGIRPRFLILENVKGLLSHDAGRTFLSILRALDGLGYAVEWQVLNSKDHGVPQNRERVIFVGYLRKRSGGKVFPVQGANDAAIKYLKSGRWHRKSILDTSGISPAVMAGETQGRYYIRELCTKRGDVVRTRPIATCLDANYAKGLDDHNARTGVIIQAVSAPDTVHKCQHGPRIKEAGEPMFALTGRERHGILLPGARIRRLTPLECFRLQAFPDSHCHNARRAGVSDAQLYKQADNAVTVSAIYLVAKRLMENLCKR
jgi:DNA (cytosine-5)-methyltransferase 1